MQAPWLYTPPQPSPHKNEPPPNSPKPKRQRRVYSRGHDNFGRASVPRTRSPQRAKVSRRYPQLSLIDLWKPSSLERRESADLDQSVGSLCPVECLGLNLGCPLSSKETVMRRVIAIIVTAVLASIVAGQCSLAKSEGLRLAQSTCSSNCTSQYNTCVRGCNAGGGSMLHVQACLTGCQTGLNACATNCQ
jgi:hypothetical protein